MSQIYACNGSMTAHGCAGLSSLPLSHVLNPLSIASLGRVVTGLNRCGVFRIQQQVLHSDAGYIFPVFPVVPLFLFVAQYRGLHPSGSIVPFPGYEVERVAFGMLGSKSLHKDTKQGSRVGFKRMSAKTVRIGEAIKTHCKIFEDSKSAQNPISGRPSCELSCV